MEKLTKTLCFSDPEVDQFRQIFVACFHKVLEEDPRVQRSPQRLPYDHIRRLLRSLGLSISLRDKQILEAKIESLDENHRREGAQLNFANFLCLMRWLLDTDFANINAVTSNE